MGKYEPKLSPELKEKVNEWCIRNNHSCNHLSPNALLCGFYGTTIEEGIKECKEEKKYIKEKFDGINRHPKGVLQTQLP